MFNHYTLLTLTFKFKCLKKDWSFEEKILTKQSLGWPNLISHGKFKSWTLKKNEENLDLLATVTLHLTEEQEAIHSRSYILKINKRIE